MNTLEIIRTKTMKTKPDQHNLGFGIHFTDHLFVMDYLEGKGWHNSRIEPYGPIALEPSAMVFHYGQTVFEGLKGYLSKAGEILLFRPEKNFERMNKSNEHLCIPTFDIDFVIDALKELVCIDKDWIPNLPGTSLYIRPFIIATDNHVGVRPSLTYKFMIILSPVGAYYAEGLNPVKIYVENQYVRAVRGGLGEAKTGANYAAGLKAQKESKINGYSQVLWLDGVERKYIDEVGTMNVFFKIDGKFITPELNGCILDGVTRDSVIKLLQSWKMEIEERKISIDEIDEAYQTGLLEEAFGTGTAAVISPIGELVWGERHMKINEEEIGATSAKLYEVLSGIQNGSLPDQFGWITKAYSTQK